MLELKRIRKAKGITQKELSEAVGYCASMIGAIENGYRNPPPKRLVKIAKALGVTAEELVGEEPEEEDESKTCC